MFRLLYMFAVLRFIKPRQGLMQQPTEQSPRGGGKDHAADSWRRSALSLKHSGHRRDVRLCLYSHIPQTN